MKDGVFIVDTKRLLDIPSVQIVILLIRGRASF